MRDFFKPWRRKLGVVTLVMACVFMGIWLRSLAHRAEISISKNNPKLDTKYVTGLNIQDRGWFASEVKTKVLNQLILTRTVTWRRIEVTNRDSSMTYPVGWRQTNYDAFKRINQHAWRWCFGEFDFGSCSQDPDESNLTYVGSTPELRAKSDPRFLMSYWTIPYWSVVIPLTLLSAWLLLVKPRPTKTTEPPLPPELDHA